jgi:hypothetical protein
LFFDFIGSKEEELALSNYFDKRKEEKSKSLKHIAKSRKKKGTT